MGSLAALPIQTSNGVTPVVAFTLVLKANVAIGRNLLQPASSRAKCVRMMLFSVRWNLSTRFD